MALVNLSEILKQANQGSFAVGAFDVFNCEMTSGVIQAAEETMSPVILAYADGFDNLFPMEAFLAALRIYAEKVSIPVCIHLDHATRLSVIERAVKCGFTSVMIDSSDKEFDENIYITRKVVSLCHPLDISVEAELGHVAGNEGMYTNDEGVYTNPDQALEFVQRTGIDALAVSVGTVHGVYKSTPILGFDRCESIKKAVNNLPLVLHGGSGLSDEDFRHIIACGINKVNIYTDLTLEALKSLRDNDLNGNKPYYSVSSDLIAAIKSTTIKKLERFGCIGKA